MRESLVQAPERELSRLLELVYESSCDPSLWPQTLTQLAHWLGATRALLFTPEAGLGSEGFFYSHGVTPEEMTIWSSGFVLKDFWSSRVLERKLDFEGSIFRDQDLSSRQELLASEYYQQHLVRMDMGWLLSAIILGRGDGTLPAVALSVYRGVHASSGFDDTMRDRMALLLPHLSRSLAVMMKLRLAEMRAAAGQAALDALSSGVLLLDARGQLVHANRQARLFVDREDGLLWQADQLMPTDNASRRAWNQALRATLADWGRVAHFSEALTVPRACGTGAYLLQISRMPANSGFDGTQGLARAIVFITDTKQPCAPDIETLVSLYKLSPSEARTAHAMGGGAQLAVVASRLGLSVNTVKTQLKQVYAKTGCSCRADLTRLLMSLVKQAE